MKGNKKVKEEEIENAGGTKMEKCKRKDEGMRGMSKRRKNETTGKREDKV